MKNIFVTFIISIFFNQYLFPISLIKDKEVELDQGKVFILGLSFFTVTKDGNFIFTDWKSATIKIFNSNGKLFGEFGRKGMGPGELVQPYFCDLYKNNFVTRDTMLNKFFVYKISKNGQLIFKRDFYWIPGVEDFKHLDEDHYIVAGVASNSSGKMFGLYSFEAKANTKNINYYVPLEIRYGISKYSTFKAKQQEVTLVGLKSKLDIWGEFAFMIWEGDLIPIKINIDSGEYKILKGHKSDRYITPFYSNELMNSITERNWQKTQKIRETMSHVFFIFAHSKYFGIVFNIPLHLRKGMESHMVQFYDHNGKFINEVPVKAEYLSKFYFRKEGELLYVLTSKLKDDFDEDIIITTYRVGK